MAVPPRSGTFMGSISFKSPDGQMVWYALEVRASEADVIDTIQVTAQVRGGYVCGCGGGKGG